MNAGFRSSAIQSVERSQPKPTERSWYQDRRETGCLRRPQVNLTYIVPTIHSIVLRIFGDGSSSLDSIVFAVRNHTNLILSLAITTKADKKEILIMKSSPPLSYENLSVEHIVPFLRSSLLGFQVLAGDVRMPSLSDHNEFANIVKGIPGTSGDSVCMYLGNVGPTGGIIDIFMGNTSGKKLAWPQDAKWKLVGLFSE